MKNHYTLYFSASIRRMAFFQPDPYSEYHYWFKTNHFQSALLPSFHADMLDCFTNSVPKIKKIRYIRLRD
jgi:hypothetical protein